MRNFFDGESEKTKFVLFNTRQIYLHGRELFVPSSFDPIYWPKKSKLINTGNSNCDSHINSCSCNSALHEETYTGKAVIGRGIAKVQIYNT